MTRHASSTARQSFALDPELLFLNHGSFGACPHAVLEAQSALRAELEADPVRFFVRELEGRLDAARERLAAFLGADAAGLVFVSNATSGVNTVLRALEAELSPGDELLTSDHAYNACRNALDLLAERTGARVHVAAIPFPLREPGEALEAFLRALTPATRVALVDHVTSPTGLVLPLEELAPALSSAGVTLVVDGAHAPGMLPLELDVLARAGVAYYTGNAHKWLCAPKGAAFLWVREDRREGLRPLVISHGANARRPDRSRLRLEFDWTGTQDPTPWLAIPAALDTLEALHPEGWPGLMRRNRLLALEGRRILAEALDIPLPAPDAMIGSLAALPLPLPRARAPGPESPQLVDPLQDALFFEERIEVPVYGWGEPSRRLVRISAAVYNERRDYERLAAALAARIAS